MIGAIKPWNGTGYALLLSAGNNVVSSPDKRAVGKPYTGTVTGDEVIRTNDPQLKEEAFITWQAITIGNSQTPWKLAIVTPVSEVMAEARQFLLKAILLMVLSIVVVSLVMAQIFTRKVDRPVGGEPSDAAGIALAVAGGDLNNAIPVRPGDTSRIFTPYTPCRCSSSASWVTSAKPATPFTVAPVKFRQAISIWPHAPKNRQRRLSKPQPA